METVDVASSDVPSVVVAIVEGTLVGMISVEVTSIVMISVERTSVAVTMVEGISVVPSVNPSDVL